MAPPQVSVEAQRGAKQAGRQAAAGGKRAAGEAQSAAQQAAPQRGGLFGRAKPPAAGAVTASHLSSCLMASFSACSQLQFNPANNAIMATRSGLEPLKIVEDWSS